MSFSIPFDLEQSNFPSFWAGKREEREKRKKVYYDATKVYDSQAAFTTVNNFEKNWDFEKKVQGILVQESVLFGMAAIPCNDIIAFGIALCSPLNQIQPSIHQIETKKYFYYIQNKNNLYSKLYSLVETR